MNLTLFDSLLQFEFARIAAVCTLLVAFLCGLLSPAVVLKQRALIGDTLAHVVFPGVVLGYLASESFALPYWACVLVGASVSGLLGTQITEFLISRLRIPQDAGHIVTLSGFFSVGVIAVSQLRGTRVDLDKILFGDVLTLRWEDAGVLAVVSTATTALMLFYRAHWDAWISDPQFARLAGFKVAILERLFPILVTAAVLTGMFAVGGLMISALITLPAILHRPRTVLSLPALAVSLCVSSAGLLLAFQCDWPVGSTIVVLGLILVLAKALVIRRGAT